MNLVVGYGQIGRALVELLGCDWIDVDRDSVHRERYDKIHIAIPYSTGFLSAVEAYQARFQADLVVIHSTVPIGTSEALDAVYSPCRGTHPDLLEGLKTFCKFFGGERAGEAAQAFMDLGVECRTFQSSRSVEAMKLWDTTQYGASIILMQEIWNFCANHGLDFDIVYRQANETYNEGYERLDPRHKRPVLRYMGEGIGGHCVIPNARLFDSETAERLLESVEVSAVA